MFQNIGVLGCCIDWKRCVRWYLLGWCCFLDGDLIGWFLWWRDPRAWLILLLVLLLCAIHAVTFGLTRFRLPLMPFMILLAAHAVYMVPGALRRGGGEER